MQRKCGIIGRFLGLCGADSRPDFAPFVEYIKNKYPGVDFSLYYDQSGNVQLNTLEVPRSSRSRGVGSAVMQELVAWADANGLLVWMSVAQRDKRSGTTSQARLLRFYSGFGFVRNKGRRKRYDLSIYATMYREPR